MSSASLPANNSSCADGCRTRLRRFYDEGLADIFSPLDNNGFYRLGQLIKRIGLFIPVIFAIIIELAWQLKDYFFSTPKVYQAKLDPAWGSSKGLELAKAAQYGEIEKIHSLLDARRTTEEKPRDFAVCAVYDACSNGQIAALQAIMEHEPDNAVLNAVKPLGVTALHWAMHYYDNTLHHKKADHACLNFLLQSGVDIEARHSYETPLHVLTGEVFNTPRKLGALEILLQHASKLHKVEVQRIMAQLTPEVPKELRSIVISCLGTYDCADYVNASGLNINAVPILNNEHAIYRAKMYSVKPQEKECERVNIEASVALTRLLLEAGALPLEISPGLELGKYDDDLTRNSKLAKQQMSSLLEQANREWNDPELRTFYEERWKRQKEQQEFWESQGKEAPIERFYSASTEAELNEK